MSERQPYPSDLNDPEWELVAPLVPPAKSGGRPREVDMRCFTPPGADLDGYPYGNVVQSGLQQPFMFLGSTGNDTNDAHYRQAIQDIDTIYNQLEIGYQVTINDARHFNFTDYAVEFSPVLRLFGMLGSIDGERGLEISRDYVLAFFDIYLKDRDSSLLKKLSPNFPEVNFKARQE
jgi:hypothetical protein